MKKSNNNKGTVKRIDFRINLEGQGIVNYDSNDQKWIFNKHPESHHMKSRYNNVSYAKKNFVDSDLNYQIKISSDCLKHHIFQSDVFAQSPSVVQNEYLLYTFLASKMSLLRGYLFASKEETLKRKSCITIVDAIQTCNAMSKLEQFSKSGQKNTDKDKETADNTFFSKETVGEIKYSSHGLIDIEEMQFVSADQVFDRYSFNPDLFELYKENLKCQIPEFDSNLGYYSKKHCIDKTPEYGILLNESVINTLIKDFITKLFSLNISKSGAYAKIASLEIKPVYDCIDDNEEWVKITSKSDIEALSFPVEIFYEPKDLKQTEVLRENILKQITVKKVTAVEKKKMAEVAKTKANAKPVLKNKKTTKASR